MNFAPADQGKAMYILKYNEITEEQAKQDVVQLSSPDKGFLYSNFVVQSNGVKITWSSQNLRVKQRPALYMESQQLMGNCCNIIQRHKIDYDMG